MPMMMTIMNSKLSRHSLVTWIKCRNSYVCYVIREPAKHSIIILDRMPWCSLSLPLPNTWKYSIDKSNAIYSSRWRLVSQTHAMSAIHDHIFESESIVIICDSFSPSCDSLVTTKCCWKIIIGQKVTEFAKYAIINTEFHAVDFFGEFYHTFRCDFFLFVHLVLMTVWPSRPLRSANGMRSKNYIEKKLLFKLNRSCRFRWLSFGLFGADFDTLFPNCVRLSDNQVRY